MSNPERPSLYCGSCGANNDTSARFCHSCGKVLSTVSPPPRSSGTMREAIPAPVRVPLDKSPALAALLSALVVGAGQFYNGDVKKGAAMLVGAIVLGTVTLGLLWFALAVWSAIDAHQVANGRGTMW
jgi:TM2 domain-containing membrane protein YozV